MGADEAKRKMMKSLIHTRGPATPRMNLTPLIDIVFLLVIFFMLVNTMAAKQLVQMIVPKLEDKPQVQELPEGERIVISVAPQDGKRDRFDPMALEGAARFVQVGTHKRFEATDVGGIREAVREMVTRYPEAPVVLRADAALYYGEVEPIMDAITSAGVGQVNMVAFLDEGAVEVAW